jgi:hypothetical protein
MTRLVPGPSHRTGPTCDWYERRNSFSNPPSYLLRVGVAPVDDGKGKGVSAEKEEDLFPLLLWELLQAIMNGFHYGSDEARMRSPAIDDTPLEFLGHSEPSRCPPKLVQAGTGGGAGKLLVLGKGYGTFDPIGPHPLQSVLGERVGVAESHVEVVRGRFRREVVEAFHHALALDVGPIEDGGSTSDVFVELPDTGGTTLGDEGP